MRAGSFTYVWLREVRTRYSVTWFVIPFLARTGNTQRRNGASDVAELQIGGLEPRHGLGCREDRQPLA